MKSNVSKPVRMASVFLAALLLLSGCAPKPPAASTAPQITLPPYEAAEAAPIGDAALEYTENALLYLPAKNGGSLTALTQPVIFSASRPREESLVRALLAHPGDRMSAPLGGGVQLGLYGANPVEVSMNTATVNLSATALQMNRGDLYLSMHAITNTLTSLGQVDYVNFLVVDRAIGLDVANTLPMGPLGRTTETNIPALYEQKLNQRVTAAERPEDKPLSTNVTLYFPAAGSPGILSEVRLVSFPGQNQQEMIRLILEQLSLGPASAEIPSPALSGLGQLLSSDPEIVYSPELGGNVICLSFAKGYDDLLEVSGISRSASLAAICYTLTTFFPGTAGLKVDIGGVPVETLLLTEDFDSSILFMDQVMQRTAFAPLLFDMCTLYYPSEDFTALLPVKRPVLYYLRQNPRFLLQQVALPPEVSGCAPAMPEGMITDASILGLAKNGGNLAVNFAPELFADLPGFTGSMERMMVYSMVNTLCENSAFSSVSFYFSGAQPETFTGEVYWPGVFYPIK